MFKTEGGEDFLFCYYVSVLVATTGNMYLILAMVFGMASGQTVNSLCFPEQGEKSSRSTQKRNKVDIEVGNGVDDCEYDDFDDFSFDVHSESLTTIRNTRLSVIPR